MQDEGEHHGHWSPESGAGADLTKSGSNWNRWRIDRDRRPLARRARIVLACAEGVDNGVVAQRLRLSPTTVCKWRARFVATGSTGLFDEPRPGAPRTITDDQVERVIVRTLETTPRGATHWSTRAMARGDRAAAT